MQRFIDELLMNQYSQSRYDFNSNALSPEEILQVKQLAVEKRSEYGIAPIGTDIFTYIRDKEQNLYFESEAFGNKELDAMIYLPNPNKESTFIILNSNQPLLNQIFATAHEYYHFLKDLDSIRENPHVCSLSQLKGKNEQKASRFAAEFLLPDQALKKHIDQWLLFIKKEEFKDANNEEIAALCYMLTIRFCMPLKAVMFRLFEEKYIDDITIYMTNYNFIKKAISEMNTRFSKRARELMETDNQYIEDIMYSLIPKAYQNGYISLDVLEEDVKILKLNKEGITESLDLENEETDEEDIDDSLRQSLLNKIDRMEGQ